MADWLGATNPAAYVWVPGVALLVGGPIYMLGITRDGSALLFALLFVAALFQYTYLGVTFGVFQNLLHSRMRATGSALLKVVYGARRPGPGHAAGRLAQRPAGAALRQRRRASSTRWLIAALIYLWAAAHYLLAGRHLRGDLAAIRERRRFA